MTMNFLWQYLCICLAAILVSAQHDRRQIPLRRIAYINSFPRYFPYRFGVPVIRRPQIGLYSRKPLSMEGWLSSPKTSNELNKVDLAPPNKKSGYCADSWNFGIKCGVRMDQCRNDRGCPGMTKCCSVSDCGFMCVKPNDKEDKGVPKKKLRVTEEKIESVTNSNGLKMEDIAFMPEKDSTNGEI